MGRPPKKEKNESKELESKGLESKELENKSKELEIKAKELEIKELEIESKELKHKELDDKSKELDDKLKEINSKLKEYNSHNIDPRLLESKYLTGEVYILRRFYRDYPGSKEREFEEVCSQLGVHVVVIPSDQSGGFVDIFEGDKDARRYLEYMYGNTINPTEIGKNNFFRKSKVNGEVVVEGNSYVLKIDSHINYLRYLILKANTKYYSSYIAPSEKIARLKKSCLWVFEKKSRVNEHVHEESKMIENNSYKFQEYLKDMDLAYEFLCAYSVAYKKPLLAKRGDAKSIKSELNNIALKEHTMFYEFHENHKTFESIKAKYIYKEALRLGILRLDSKNIVSSGNLGLILAVNDSVVQTQSTVVDFLARNTIDSKNAVELLKEKIELKLKSRQ